MFYVLKMDGVKQPLQAARAVEQAFEQFPHWQTSPKVIQVRPMKRKWSSCSTSGLATFDAILLRQRPDSRQRVIVEELLHLRIPNHGTLFKTMLSAYLRRQD